jgi:hypothetical protein
MEDLGVMKSKFGELLSRSVKEVTVLAMETARSLVGDTVGHITNQLL